MSLRVREQEIDRETEAKFFSLRYTGPGLTLRENTEGPLLEINFHHQLSSHNTNITINDSISL